jgi:hypothetical protein
MRFKYIFILAIIGFLMLIANSSAWAIFEKKDFELPNPIFTKQGNEWVAKLIPRGRTNAIEIHFGVHGGTLEEISSKVFTDNDNPDISWKNYWSGFFLLNIIPDEPGGEITLSLSSRFFSPDTELWGEKKQDGAWGNIGYETKPGKEDINIIKAVIRDGNIPDKDGIADGTIKLVIGPRDHFWSFAVGSLIIRTLIVFLMLVALMLGVMLSGKAFQYFGNKTVSSPDSKTFASSSAVKQADVSRVSAPAAFKKPEPEVAAAIAMAIHLYTNGGRDLNLATDDMTAAAIGLALHLETEK